VPPYVQSAVYIKKMKFDLILCVNYDYQVVIILRRQYLTLENISRVKLPDKVCLYTYTQMHMYTKVHPHTHEHTATSVAHYNKSTHIVRVVEGAHECCNTLYCIAIHCNTHCNTYIHIVCVAEGPHECCNTLQHTATRCNTQHSATRACNSITNSINTIRVAKGSHECCNTLQHTATHCTTLQHTAQHTATHIIT